MENTEVPQNPRNPSSVSQQASCDYLGLASVSKIGPKGTRLLTEDVLREASSGQLERELLYILQHWHANSDIAYLLTNVVNLYRELGRRGGDTLSMTAQQAKRLDCCLKVAKVAKRPISCKIVPPPQRPVSEKERFRGLFESLVAMHLNRGPVGVSLSDEMESILYLSV